MLLRPNRSANIFNLDQLQQIAQQYQISYTFLLLDIWFNLLDLTVEKTIQVQATDVNPIQRIYTPFGEAISSELGKLLRGSSWHYTGPRQRSDVAHLTITTPSSKFVLASDKPFSPRITIAGSQTHGEKLYSISELPEPSGFVKITETS